MSDLPVVVKNARGIKRKCLSCELPFYDLSKTPIVCPNCSETFVPVVVEAPLQREPRPVSNVRRAPWSQKKERPEPEVTAEKPPKAEGEDQDDIEDVADVEDVEDDDDIKADDDTLLDPEAESDDEPVVIAPKSDDD